MRGGCGSGCMSLPRRSVVLRVARGVVRGRRIRTAGSCPGSVSWRGVRRRRVAGVAGVGRFVAVLRRRVVRIGVCPWLCVFDEPEEEVDECFECHVNGV